MKPAVRRSYRCQGHPGGRACISKGAPARRVAFIITLHSHGPRFKIIIITAVSGYSGALRIPGTIPGGYPDQLRGGFFNRGHDLTLWSRGKRCLKLKRTLSRRLNRSSFSCLPVRPRTATGRHVVQGRAQGHAAAPYRYAPLPPNQLPPMDCEPNICCGVRSDFNVSGHGRAFKASALRPTRCCPVCIWQRACAYVRAHTCAYVRAQGG